MNEGSSVNLAFSKQAMHFDADDLANPILQAWRKQVYAHIERFLKPGDRLLELNAGTGIDAFYFAKMGHPVHATDISTGMVRQMEKKMAEYPIPHLSCQQISFEHLDQIAQHDFDYVYSNFGGLNCIKDLSLVTTHLSKILKPGAYVTLVIMPPFCPWELLRILKGKPDEAFRRFRHNGTMAHLEGEYFKTYYHSLSDIRKALEHLFTFVKSEGLGVFSAPPAAIQFHNKYPRLNRVLRKIDLTFKDHFPFNRWGDHMIVTFKKSTLW